MKLNLATRQIYQIFGLIKEKERNKDNISYLENKARNDMCGIKELFTDINASIQGEAKFGDTSKIPKKAKGKIMIQTKNRRS